jgi:hypothetical protein
MTLKIYSEWTDFQSELNFVYPYATFAKQWVQCGCAGIAFKFCYDWLPCDQYFLVSCSFSLALGPDYGNHACPWMAPSCSCPLSRIFSYWCCHYWKQMCCAWFDGVVWQLCNVCTHNCLSGWWVRPLGVVWPLISSKAPRWVGLQGLVWCDCGYFCDTMVPQ